MILLSNWQINIRVCSREKRIKTGDLYSIHILDSGKSSWQPGHSIFVNIYLMIWVYDFLVRKEQKICVQENYKFGLLLAS